MTRYSNGTIGYDGYTIVPVRGHYEIFDKQGKFLCSADTEKEAIKDVDSMSQDCG